MNENLVEVSVIIPCFNDGKYIQESIDSVFNQSCKNFEIIIVNDGSDDSYTNKILSKINNDKITIINLDKNSGPSIARNIAIKKARGKYILPLDADDKIAPTYLEKAKDVLVRDYKVGIVYCRVKLFGKARGEWVLPEYSFDKILIDNMIFATAMFRKKDWKDVGGYNEKMVYGLEDYDFWLALIEKEFKVHRIDEILFFYRKKGNSRTLQLAKENENQLKMFTQLVYNHIDLYVDNIDVVIRRLRALLTNESKLIQKISEQEATILRLQGQSKCVKICYSINIIKEKVKQMIKKIIKGFM